MNSVSQKTVDDRRCCQNDIFDDVSFSPWIVSSCHFIMSRSSACAQHTHTNPTFTFSVWASQRRRIRFYFICFRGNRKKNIELFSLRWLYLYLRIGEKTCYSFIRFKNTFNIDFHKLIPSILRYIAFYTFNSFCFRLINTWSTSFTLTDKYGEYRKEEKRQFSYELRIIRYLRLCDAVSPRNEKKKWEIDLFIRGLPYIWIVFCVLFIDIDNHVR